MKSPAPSCDRHAADSLARRGTVALFLALTLALGAGLLASGPMLTGVALPHGPDGLAVAGWQDAIVLVGSVLLVLAGAGGWRSSQPLAGTGSAMARPWAWFFVIATAQGLASGLHHALGAECTRVLLELCCAAGSAWLFLGLMADRLQARWFDAPVRLAALALSVLATGWWVGGLVLHGSGDLRGLLFIDALPLLALAAGVGGLPAGKAGQGDIAVPAAAYGAARLLSLANGGLLPDFGPVVSQGASLYLIAGACLWFARRLSLPAEPATQPTASAVAPASKTRSTSLNTSA